MLPPCEASHDIFSNCCSCYVNSLDGKCKSGTHNWQGREYWHPTHAEIRANFCFLSWTLGCASAEICYMLKGFLLYYQLPELLVCLCYFDPITFYAKSNYPLWRITQSKLPTNNTEGQCDFSCIDDTAQLHWKCTLWQLFSCILTEYVTEYISESIQHSVINTIFKGFCTALVPTHHHRDPSQSYSYWHWLILLSLH